MTSEENRITEYLFPTLYQVTQHPSADIFDAALMKEILVIRDEVPNGKPSNWSYDHYTTMTTEGRLHLRSCLKSFAKSVTACAIHYGEIMRYHYREKRLHLNDCWLNIYGRGHSQDIHNHPSGNKARW